MANAFTLIIAILTIESSYLQEVERPARAVPDTVQFWFTPDSQWRIKTFAIDHDIHVHRIGVGENGTRLTAEFAQENIKKTYGDVTATLLTVEFPDPTNQADVQRILKQHHLLGKLEAVSDGYYFFNPDSGDYRTKSKPK
ncbi:MAG TPA: hypothetical protein VK961_21800 [Chthoniobacter sp.]|nr:hypothetical protein [Chthoniobacter sp.]